MRTYLATALVLAVMPAVIHSGLDQDRGSTGPAPAAAISQSTRGGGHHPFPRVAGPREQRGLCHTPGTRTYHQYGHDECVWMDVRRERWRRYDLVLF
jgi:hypothetical protein